jgi:hypothetical protein
MRDCGAMNDRVRIQAGAHPWQPSPESELVATYHQYDKPLVGLLRQNGSLFLFRCVEGHADDVSLWVYSAVSEEDVSTIDAVDDIDAELDRLLSGVPLVFAVSSDDAVVGSGLLEQPGSNRYLERAIQAAQLDLERLQSLSH